MTSRSAWGVIFREIAGRADLRGVAGACLLKKGAHGGNMVSLVKEHSRRRAT
jgi:hypothetical protein